MPAKVRALVDRHREAAERVLAELNAAHKRLGRRASYVPSYDTLRGISERLEAGATVEQCLHVVAYREVEVRGDATKSMWLNPSSSFRAESFAVAVAGEPGEVAQRGQRADGRTAAPPRGIHRGVAPLAKGM